MGDHRIERAMERYGVGLTQQDVAAIAAIAKPCNCVQRRESGAAVHVIVWNKVALIAVIRQRDIGPVVATFLPSDALTRSHRKRWLQGRKQPPRAKRS